MFQWTQAEHSSTFFPDFIRENRPCWRRRDRSWSWTGVAVQQRRHESTNEWQWAADEARSLLKHNSAVKSHQVTLCFNQYTLICYPHSAQPCPRLSASQMKTCPYRAALDTTDLLGSGYKHSRGAAASPPWLPQCHVYCNVKQLAIIILIWVRIRVKVRLGIKLW